MSPKVELVYFEGCPNAAAARRHLREALHSAGLEAAWEEWNLADPATPYRFKQFGSPTVLVDGRDVTGEGGAAAAMACRADGAPSPETIAEALRASAGEMT